MFFEKSDITFRQCKLSVMDNIADPDIRFDNNGICNYFYEYIEAEKGYVKKGTEGEKEVDRIVSLIKKDGAGKKYDCILGVSGGVDSTYLAYLASKAGLKVLCVHFDNGWNSELAVENIQSVVSKLGFDLYTYVIDWLEFRDIQLAYFKANVIDIEAITDLAIFSAIDMLCRKFGIKHIIDGRNVVTESVLPQSWFCKNISNLKDIHAKFGTLQLKSYPVMSPLRRRVIAKTKPFLRWGLLNYVPYIKSEAKQTIIHELGWRDYGGKHYESVFTRFYQGYILPEKFGVDKRKAHLSNLIFSGQITKEEALTELAMPAYPAHLLKTDMELVIKKLGFTQEEFDAYIKTPPQPHSNYKMGISIFDEYSMLKPFKKIFRK